VREEEVIHLLCLPRDIVATRVRKGEGGRKVGEVEKERRRE
jgi:hypothetical protein